MREERVCRLCDSQLGSLRNQMGGRKPFAISGASPHYAPDRPFKLEHILLDVRVDPKTALLQGVVTQSARAVVPDLRRIKLDQVGLQIEEASIQGKKVTHEVEGNHLYIYLDASPAVGEVVDFSVRFKVERPRRGLYFTGPDQEYPNKPYQVWTQGQDEDNRYWFPTFDYPNQKVTSEVIATVPKGFTAVSNGALLSRKDLDKTSRFHYKLGTPHVTYLITLVVAEFFEWTDTGPRGLPVQYFVPAGREADGKRSFGNTPLMIECFEKMTGIPYPYEKYSQVAVQDFIFGGMENTSATTQTDLTLHDERAHLDFSSDPLVAHELAHQWFGDLLTCRDWSHAWLNEGFATFMERVWIEGNKGSGGGMDEAKYYSYQDLKDYQNEDQNRYRRPIVCNTYAEPIDLFDRHLYQKGGLVLNLIRKVLGESLFWKSVQLYLSRHREKNVETADLIRAIEDATGRNLRRLFDEWVFSAGYPEFEVTYAWHEDKKLTEWVIEQKQTGGAPSVVKEGATTPVFHLPVILELTMEGNQKITHAIEIGEVRERVFLPAPGKPLMVRFDPGASIPKSLKFPRPKEMLLYQLKFDEDCMGRIEAAQELVKNADAEIVRELGKAVQSDAFWGVQAEAAKTLAEVRTDHARDLLILALQVPHPKARRAVVSALGTFKDEKAAGALKKVAEKDESYYVEADSVYSWAHSRVRPFESISTQEVEEAEKFLLGKLEQSSYREVIRSSALKGLAELKGIAKGERTKAFDALIQWSRRGKPLDARMASVRGLGKILKNAVSGERSKVLEIFSHLADEDNFRLRSQIVLSLEESGCMEAIPILSKIRQLDLDGRVRRSAQTAVDTLISSGGIPDTVMNLKSALEKLEEDTRKLRSWVEERR